MSKLASPRDYQLACDRIEKEVNSSLAKYATTPKFAAISANFYNLLPGVPVTEHLAAASRVLVAERLAALDQRHVESIFPHVTAEGNVPTADDPPAIYCSYHLGPYRITIPYLIERGLKLTVVTDKNVMQQQGDQFEKLAQEFCRERGISEDNYRWRDTSDGSLLLSLVRDLREGRSVFFYIDGNTSVSGYDGDRQKNAVRIDFLGTPLFARAGIATLAYLSKRKVIPVVAHRSSSQYSDVRLEFKEELTSLHSDRADYVSEISQLLWQVLGDELARDPFVWEPWRYVHRFLDVEKLENKRLESVAKGVPDAPDQAQSLDRDRFVLATRGEENFLFDRLRYKFYPVSDAFKQVLEQVLEDDTRVSALNDATRNRLVEIGLVH